MEQQELSKVIVERTVGGVPVLSVRDLDEGLEFYQKLGFVLDSAGEGRAMLSRSSGRLQLEVDATLTEENSGGAFFHVDCADAFMQDLSALEIAVRDKLADRPWRMREFSVSDPDGNLLRFGEKFQDGVYF